MMTVQNNLQKLWNKKVVDLAMYGDITIDLADAILDYESSQYNYKDAPKTYAKLKRVAKKYSKTAKECEKIYDDFRSKNI